MPSPVSAALEPVRFPRTAKRPLADAYAEFRRHRRRILAREVASWTQLQARSHFVSDGALDRWPTFHEVLESRGDDCDGLALLAFRMLRELGFAPGEVYQGIVRQLENGDHHMVTFWFEDPDDPWVIDPTGAMVTELTRMSAVSGWRPVKLFSATEDYSVRGEETPPR